MGIIKSINLLVAFLLELCLLVIFGFWGVHVSQTRHPKNHSRGRFAHFAGYCLGDFPGSGLVNPLNRTRIGNSQNHHLFLATLVLFSTGKQNLAIWFGSISIVNLILLYIYR